MSMSLGDLPRDSQETSLLTNGNSASSVIIYASRAVVASQLGHLE